ncbi:MAG: PilZ domain-containing protein [Nitrospira sp.]|jgi:hypothetical protein|nr:PilZ domain-containing protein [Nitrospira sp.]
MVPSHYARTYPRFPLHCPVIIGGTSFVGEGVLTNLSLKGCSVMCDRELLRGSDVRVSVLLPDQPSALPIDLGTVKWVEGHQFGVEFLRLPFEARQRLNGALRLELIRTLKSRADEQKGLSVFSEYPSSAAASPPRS